MPIISKIIRKELVEKIGIDRLLQIYQKKIIGNY